MSSIRQEGTKSVLVLAKDGVNQVKDAHAAVIQINATVTECCHPVALARRQSLARRHSIDHVGVGDKGRYFCNPYAKKGLNETSLKFLAVRGNSH